MADIQVQLTKVLLLEALPSMELVPPILICQSYWVLNLQTLKIQLTWSVQNHVLPLPPQPLHPQIVPTLQLLHANPTSRIAWQGRALSRCCTICFLFSSFCLFDFFFVLPGSSAWPATTLFNFRSCSAHNFKNSGKIFIFFYYDS